MPIIKIYGMPSGSMFAPKKETLQMLANEIKKAAASIEELKIEPGMVNVFFPLDALDQNGEELMVFVDGLFDKPERTPEVRKQLAQVIKNTLEQFCDQHLPSCRLIEVFVKPFNEKKNGFAQFIRPKPMPES